LATREIKAEFLKEKKIKLAEEMVRLDEEILFLEKYECEEDYVADKLHQILKADDPEAISKILKELRKSNYL
jgi:hypothetical protein